MRKSVAAIVPALLLASCTGPAADQPVSIGFVLKSGAEAVTCTRPLPGLNKKATLTDSRLYVHSVSLIDPAGRTVPVALTPSSWQRDGIVLLDFENAAGTCRGDPATNTAITGTVPAGRYTGLNFVIGVPAPLNHTSTNTEAAPLDLVAMGWSWQAGRKFIKIEVDPEGGIARKTGKPGISWNLHLGSTGCAGDPVKGETVTCTSPNRVPVTLPVFDTSREQVVIDLARLFDGSDLGRDGGGALGCMSGADDPDCPAIFRQLGLTPVTTLPPALRIEPKG
jgi:uncharacterized repeat protein (TIGR04052 family)